VETGNADLPGHIHHHHHHRRQSQQHLLSHYYSSTRISPKDSK
jgi:hypothetical protein